MKIKHKRYVAQNFASSFNKFSKTPGALPQVPHPAQRGIVLCNKLIDTSIPDTKVVLSIM